MGADCELTCPTKNIVSTHMISLVRPGQRSGRWVISFCVWCCAVSEWRLMLFISTPGVTQIVLLENLLACLVNADEVKGQQCEHRHRFLWLLFSLFFNSRIVLYVMTGKNYRFLHTNQEIHSYLNTHKSTRTPLKALNCNSAKVYSYSQKIQALLPYLHISLFITAERNSVTVHRITCALIEPQH